MCKRFIPVTLINLRFLFIFFIFLHGRVYRFWVPEFEGRSAAVGLLTKMAASGRGIFLTYRDRGGFDQSNIFTIFARTTQEISTDKTVESSVVA